MIQAGDDAETRIQKRFTRDLQMIVTNTVEELTQLPSDSLRRGGRLGRALGMTARNMAQGIAAMIAPLSDDVEMADSINDYIRQEVKRGQAEIRKAQLKEQKQPLPSATALTHDQFAKLQFEQHSSLAKAAEAAPPERVKQWNITIVEKANPDNFLFVQAFRGTRERASQQLGEVWNMRWPDRSKALLHLEHITSEPFTITSELVEVVNYDDEEEE